VISLLGTPLSKNDKGEVTILVYTSLVSENADVLYFVNDALKLKSLSVKKDGILNTDLEYKDPDSTYVLLADNRGTANEQWLSFWQDEGFAYIADKRLPGFRVDRVLYFEPMDFRQFSQVWGGSKFIKGSEKPITEITNLEVQTVQKTEELSGKEIFSNPFFLFLPIFLLLLVVLLIGFFIIRKKKKSSVETDIENQPNN
jgi:hypothetical protein